ncbi:mechanosensitive ion channel protein MscS, partial [Vibrio vulnificus]
DKLSYINDYRELQQYLDATFESSYQNISWLEKLDVDTASAKEKLTREVKQRLQLLSASIAYLKQQNDTIAAQINTSPESEKASLQVARIFMQQRLEMSTASLRSITSLADKLEIETSDYKRQIFEATGNITYELVDRKVAFSIIKHWSDNAVNWLATNAVQYLFQIFIFLLILLAAKGTAKIASRL